MSDFLDHRPCRARRLKLTFFVPVVCLSGSSLFCLSSLSRYGFFPARNMQDAVAIDPALIVGPELAGAIVGAGHQSSDENGPAAGRPLDTADKLLLLRLGVLRSAGALGPYTCSEAGPSWSLVRGVGGGGSEGSVGGRG